MVTRIYLDSNASTFLDPQVIEHIIDVLPRLGGNPSSIHVPGQKARALVTKARASIAAFLKIKPQDLIFNSGGTEGANMIMRGWMEMDPKGHIITSMSEHSCVYATAKYLQERGANVTFLSPGFWGAVSPDDVRAAIRPETKLIALMAVNNETGVKTDIGSIAAIANQYEIPFFVDAVSWMGKELITIPDGISAMSFAGHKLHAPQGIGMCFIRSGLKLKSLSIGGGHEFGRRAGTENVIGITAMAKAVELLSQVFPEATVRMQSLRDEFESLLKNGLEGVSVNGLGPRICNVSNVAFSGVDGETLLMAMDREGVAASHGSACASGALEPSRVLISMGFSPEHVNSSLRFSLSRFTTPEEIQQASSIIIKLVKHLRK